MSLYILYFGLTWILIWFIQTQKIFGYIKWQLFQEMRSCDFCCGFWVSLLLFPFFKISILDFLDNTQILNFLASCIVTSIVNTTWVKFTKEGFKKLYWIEIIR